MVRANVPDLGFYTAKRVPGPAQRRVLGRPVHKVRVCHDNRVYVAIPFTMVGIQTVGKKPPEWRADRDYYIAKIMAEVGLHDESTHPNDGTPSGSPLKFNVHRVNRALSEDVKILGSDSRLVIAENHHQDVINDVEAGPMIESDFRVRRLAEGDRVYVDCLQVGSVRPGTHGVVTLTLVPIP